MDGLVSDTDGGERGLIGLGEGVVEGGRSEDKDGEEDT